MNKPIYVLNGPNLNRLGKREPEIYGATTLAEVEASCRTEAEDQAIEFRQTNSEAANDRLDLRGDRRRLRNHHQSRRFYVHVNRDS